MTVIEGLCGDEDDNYLAYEFFMETLKVALYDQLINFDPSAEDCLCKLV